MKIKLKIENLQNKIARNRGMTYVELIIVLGIFGLMSSIVLFNYNQFQAKVDIKNLANDIALKVVENQKIALAGRLSTHDVVSSWKPAYGVYFTTLANSNADSKSFINFVDINNNNNYDDSSCSPSDLNSECLDKINITKSSYISNLDAFYQNGDTSTLDNITISFTRPNSGANIKSTISGVDTTLLGLSYVQISISSPAGVTGRVKVYASGRIQIN